MQTTRLSCSTTRRLEATLPFSFELTVRKPAGWSFLTPFELFENGTLWTAMRMDSGELFGLKLRSEGPPSRPAIRCELFSKEPFVASRKRTLFDTVRWFMRLNEDLGEFYALAETDSLVRLLTKDLHGMRRTVRPDIFPSLILAVTLQMAPIARSEQMMNLLIQEYGAKIIFDRKEILYWPSPAKIADQSVPELKSKCKLGYRATTLKGIAETLCKGYPSLMELEGMSSEEARAKLMDLRGIGEYSADIVSPHFGFPLDVWSAKIFSRLLVGKPAVSPRELIPTLKKLAEERWGKWRGYVFVYVLNDLVNVSKTFGLDA